MKGYANEWDVKRKNSEWRASFLEILHPGRAKSEYIFLKLSSRHHSISKGRTEHVPLFAVSRDGCSGISGCRDGLVV